MYWAKTSEQALHQLRLLTLYNRQVQSKVLAPGASSVLKRIGFSQSASYCRTRYLYKTWMYPSSRYFHLSSHYCKKHDISDDKSQKDEIAPVGNTLPEKKILEEAPLPKPVLEEREPTLPNHDVKRITKESQQLSLTASVMLDEIAAQKGANKATFLMAVNRYIAKESLYRRGAVEFIYACLHEMKRFGVEKDLTAYKALIQAFPEGKMIPTNVWQVEFMHYPRQQQCGIDLLEQMEHNAVIPDSEFGKLLQNRFGLVAHVTRKYRRMMYWMPKFKNMNPYPIPLQLPSDPIQLALLALKRMCVDKETEYTVYQTSEMEDVPEDTFIASAQSPTQQKLLSKHSNKEPLFVEGPYPVYLKNVYQKYFLLRAEPNVNALMKEKQRQAEEENDDNLFEWTNFFEEEESKELRPILSVHEQEDSTILALSITGTSTKNSVVSWIKCLEKSNPNLVHTPVLFKLISPDSQLEAIGDNRPFREVQKT